MRKHTITRTIKGVYFELEASERKKIREKICKELEISEEVFRARLRAERSWPKMDRKFVCEAFKVREEDLQWES